MTFELNKKNYTFKEVFDASLDYFKGDELAANVFATKYALYNPKTNLYDESTPIDMHKRLTKEFARIESKYSNGLSEEEIYSYLSTWEIVPQGSPMSGINNPYQIQSLGNCYVVKSPSDSYAGILRADQELIQIFKRRGGAGVDISNFRPKGDLTQNAAKTTDGIAVFMERYSNSCREVAQCVAKGERVLTRQGLKEIQDVNTGDEVWTRQGWINVLELKSNGPKKIVKTITNFGYSIKTTIDHIFLDGNGMEKRLDDFEAGDEICLIPGITNELPMVKLKTELALRKNGTRTNRKVILPNYLNEDLAYLIGYSYGDGCVNYSTMGWPNALSLACSNDYPAIKEKLIKIAQTIFEYDIRPRAGDGALEELDINSVIILQFLEENRLLKEKSAAISMPVLIFNSPTKVQAAFLAGYFDADGYASGKKKGYVFSSVAPNFLKDVQTILMTNGIVSKIHMENRDDKGWLTLYSLCVVGSSAQKRFVNTIGEYSIKVSLSKFIAKRDCIITPYSPVNIGINYGKYNYLEQKQKMSVESYQRYMAEPDAIPGTHKNVLIKDSIVSIENINDEEETFDLILEKEHLYFCEGFYIHNSGRRGAEMQTISIHHPEIRTFINIKRDLKKVTGANISIRITDEFMKAVENKEKYELRFPVDPGSKVYELADANSIWNEIIESAHSMGEPGVLFWDAVQKNTPSDIYKDKGYESISTNPCSEIVLEAYGVCRLLLVNTLKFVTNPFTAKASFDHERFKMTVKVAQRLMDDLVDLDIEAVDRIINKINDDPEDELTKMYEINLWKQVQIHSQESRRVGLGVTAIGDTLAALNICYGTKNSIKTVGALYKSLALACYEETINLAEERGAFPIFNYKQEKDHLFIKKIIDELPPKSQAKYKKYGRRNIALTTTAPAGSVSLLTQTTSGIEPAYMLKYDRWKKINQTEVNARIDRIDALGDSWQKFVVYHHGFKAWMDISGKTNVEDSPYYKATANEIDWINRIKCQAAAQEWICHSISSTINVPSDISVDTVKQIYMEGWRTGCKGLTVYRDGSRDGVLTSSENNKKSNFGPVNAIKRPDMLLCEVHRVKIKDEDWTVFLGLLDGNTYEIIGGLSKYVTLPRKIKEGRIIKTKKGQNSYYNFSAGKDEDLIEVKDLVNVFENPTYGSFTRTLSLALRHGASVQHVVEQLQKGDKDSDMFTFSKVISRVLKTKIKDGTKINSTCSQCNSDAIEYREGCATCMSCGYSKCG